MKYGVIVDGYSSGAELAEEFKRLGFACIHVQSSSYIPAVYLKSFRHSSYVQNFIFDGNLPTLLGQLKKFQPVFALSGSEPGVELTDLIANGLNLSAKNPLESSPARRDKFLMSQRLAECGLQIIPQFKSDSLDAILKWAAEYGTWPLIIKPLKSAGGDKVKVCYNQTDVTQGFHDILTDKPNFLGLQDTEVLIQKYIEAPEFAINSVQCQGMPYLAEVWQFHKRLIQNGRKIYDYAALLSAQAYPSALKDYALKVAEALEINFGPMHAEIFLSEQGPILIEAAARLMGANIPFSLMHECLTYSQAEMTVLAYADPRAFMQKSATPAKILQNIRIVFLISTVQGQLAKIHHLEQIKNLPSFFGVKIRLQDDVFLTTDYDTSPGLVYLRHPDESVIEQDYLMIRELEKTMYEVV